MIAQGSCLENTGLFPISCTWGKTMTEKESITMGQWAIGALDALLIKASSLAAPGERIDFISRNFLGTTYQESTLIGGDETEEVFVINLAGMDCFTFVDYVEAMRLSSSFHEFRENLKRIRYRSGVVAFAKRNHFFTDWPEFNASVEDVTEDAGLDKIMAVRKELNIREDGKYFVPGIEPVQREISYIPSSLLDDTVLDSLATGDYIGLYSELRGLDVSHVGIFVREAESISLRHASSNKEYRKVIDQDFVAYVKNRPGIVVLRPKG
jgi:hypothetical protein